MSAVRPPSALGAVRVYTPAPFRHSSSRNSDGPRLCKRFTLQMSRFFAAFHNFVNSPTPIYLANAPARPPVSSSSPLHCVSERRLILIEMAT